VAANPSLQLPQSSLHGNVQTALFNFDVTSRPLQAPVTFTLKYRLYDYMDFSDQIRFQAFIINDQNAITSTPFTAGRYDFLRQNADLAWALPVRAEHRAHPRRRLGRLEPEPQLRGDAIQRGPRQGFVRLYAH
jgi:hypothetical protein